MEATQTRQLLTYDQAMKLAGVSQRTFYRRLANGLIPIYTDPADRRRRWIDRRDVPLLQGQDMHYGREYDGSAA